MPTRRSAERHAALDELKDLFRRGDSAFVIHYSCESLEQPDGRTPRVTSVAIRNLKSGQTQCFCIHKEAELAGKLPPNPEDFDQLERQLLGRLFQFFKEHKDALWLHWNMRDVTYGFHAIEQRHLVLGGEPYTIPDESKRDISRALVAIYGASYTPHPRLKTIMEANDITSLGFMSGSEEAAAFARGEFSKVSQSTSRKVDVLAELAKRAVDSTLKTRSKLFEKYGLSLRGFVDMLMDNPLVPVLGVVASVIAIGAAVLRCK